LKSAFIEVASHEFNTPITLVLGLSELLRLTDTGRDERERAIVERISGSARQLARLVANTLTLMRADDFGMTLKREPVELAPLLRGVAERVMPFVRARGQDLRVELAEDLGVFEIDAAKIGDAIVNLLTNAIKFTDPGGKVTISGGTGQSIPGTVLSGPGPWLYVKIEDTGRGIPPEHLDRIFEAFQQSERADQHRGAGLGLSISRQLARLMGGDLTAQSELGVGSQFTLWLPITSSDPVPR
jgi:signal transduction histidine kinase